MMTEKKTLVTGTRVRVNRPGTPIHREVYVVGESHGDGTFALCTDLGTPVWRIDASWLEVVS